jgi:hypothetical protein
MNLLLKDKKGFLVRLNKSRNQYYFGYIIYVEEIGKDFFGPDGI